MEILRVSLQRAAVQTSESQVMHATTTERQQALIFVYALMDGMLMFFEELHNRVLLENEYWWPWESADAATEFLSHYVNIMTQAGFSVSCHHTAGECAELAHATEQAGTNSHAAVGTQGGGTLQLPLQLFRQKKPYKKDTDFATIASCFHMPISKASEHLQICPTLLKRICRSHGVHRWPYRKVNAIAAATRLQVLDADEVPNNVAEAEHHGACC